MLSRLAPIKRVIGDVALDFGPRFVCIWLLDIGVATVEPWRDPRRSEEDRHLWLASKPRSLDPQGYRMARKDTAA